MSFSRTKILLSFAFIGFLGGVSLYFLLSWLIIGSALQAMSILDVVSAPWFLSGIAGSLLSIVLVYFAARFSSKK